MINSQSRPLFHPLAWLSGVSQTALLMGQLGFVILLFSIPALVGNWKTHGDYQPFSVGDNVSAQVYDETQLYVSGPRWFALNGTLNSEVDIKELQTRSNGYPILHSLIIGSVARALGSLETSWIFFHAVLPALVWLLFYSLFSHFSESSLIRSCASWCAVIFPFSPRHSLLQGRMALYQPLELMRTPHPSLSYAVILFAVFALTQTLRSEKKLSWLALGISVGLSFYVYYFDWVALSLGLSLCFFYSLLLKQFELSKRLVGAGLVAAITATPYFLRVLTASKEGSQNALMARVGNFSHFSPTFWIIYAVVGAITLLPLQRLVLSQSKQGHLRFALLVVIVGACLGLNFQILTGYDAQHAHFFNRVLQPTLFALVISWLVQMKWRGLSKIFLLGAALLTSLGCYRQYISTLNTLSEHRKSQPENELLAWVNHKHLRNQVLASSNPKFSMLIPALSPNWTFVPAGDRSMASDDEILKRYLLVSKLEGKTLTKTLEELSAPPQDGDRLWQSANYVLFLRHGDISEKERELSKEYWEKANLKAELSQREMDYLLLPVGQSVSKEVKETFPSMHSIYSNSGFEILELTQ